MTKKQLIPIIIAAVLLVVAVVLTVVLLNPSIMHMDVRCGFEVQYIRTGAGRTDVRVISSAEELTDYTNAHFTPPDEGEVPEEGTFPSAVQKYGEQYFKDQVLILVTLEEPSGSIRHDVTSLVRSDDGRLTVSVDRISPQVQTDDMAGWHIMIEPEPGITVDYDTDVTLLVDGENVMAGTRTVYNGYRDEANISVDIPEGWVYDTVDYTGSDSAQAYLATSFWPEDRPEGKITLKFMYDRFDPDDQGVKIEKCAGKSDMNSTTVHYAEGETVWRFITFTDDLPGTYVVLNEGADAWWGEYGVEAERILNSVKYADGLNRRSDIIQTAIRECDVDYSEYTVEYRDGRWYVYFYTADLCVPAQTVWIYSDSLSGFDGQFYF